MVRGIAVYRRLGCQLCHRALGYGAPGAVTFAPSLDYIGLRGSGYLFRSVIEHPAATFKGTVMPAFSEVLASDPEARTR